MIVIFKESGQAQQRVDSLEGRYKAKEVEGMVFLISMPRPSPEHQATWCEERQALWQNHADAALARWQNWPLTGMKIPLPGEAPNSQLAPPSNQIASRHETETKHLVSTMTESTSQSRDNASKLSTGASTLINTTPCTINGSFKHRSAIVKNSRQSRNLHDRHFGLTSNRRVNEHSSRANTACLEPGPEHV